MAQTRETGRRGKVKQDVDVFKGSIDVVVVAGTVEKTESEVLSPEYASTPEIILGNPILTNSGGSASDHVVSVELQSPAVDGFDVRVVVDADPGVGETATATVPFTVKGVVVDA